MLGDNLMLGNNIMRSDNLKFLRLIKHDIHVGM